MTREIKFRAWDRDNKIMRNGLEIAFYEPKNGNLRSDYHISEKSLQTGDLSSYELMQFTGLKDKNGKEIYEGDIVRGEHFGEGQEVRRVEINQWGVQPFAVTTFSASAGCEVIGNIYENPDLLK